MKFVVLGGVGLIDLITKKYLGHLPAKETFPKDYCISITEIKGCRNLFQL